MTNSDMLKYLMNLNDPKFKLVLEDGRVVTNVRIDFSKYRIVLGTFVDPLGYDETANYFWGGYVG